MADIVPTKSRKLSSEEVKSEIVDIRKHLSNYSIRLAQLLKRVKEFELYKEWGCDTFEEAIADPDISISRSTAYGLIQVWDTWIERFGKSPAEVAKIPYDKLLLIAPIINDDNHEEMFENAKALSRQDLNHIKVEKQSNVGMPDFKPMPRLWRCKTCGKYHIDETQDNLCWGH